MQVTKVEALTKTKWKVELDGQFAFVLYKKEISRFGIEVNGELSEELYEQIKKNVVLKRAKLRAMHLLTDMARTESQLRDKLKRNMYPEDVISQAIAYVKSFGYINDERYVRNYIECRCQSKSRRQLEQELQFRKGVSPELIQQVYEELEPVDQCELIRKHLEKKHYRNAEADDRQKRSVIASLARKGFCMSDIISVMKETD